MSTTDRRAPVRVFIVDDHALFRPGVRAELGGARSTSSARPATSARRSRGSGATAPTSCCSTCTCPTAAGCAVLERGARSSARTSCSWRCRCPTRPRTSSRVIRAGARGYVTKTISADDLADAIAPGGRRRRRLQPAAGRLRARRVRDAPAVAVGRPRARPAHAAASARCCGCSRGATPTRRSRPSCSSRSRPSRPTCRACCARPQSSNRHELSRWASDRRLV